ncbi:MAG: hypothetical protein V1913_16960 [Fibrobacterota bacterium]
MNLDKMIGLLQELIRARGPSGQEEEVRQIVLREMEKTCDKVWTDEAENAVGLILGQGRAGRGKKTAAAPIIKVMAHLDEISLIVKRIEPDGTLRVRPIGGLVPWLLGLGPMEIMADTGILPGVLSVGPMHTTAESTASWKAKVTGEGKSLDWPQIHVFTRMTAEALAKAGVRPGTRVVVSRDRRNLTLINDCLGGYFMDDRASLVIMLAAAALLKSAKKRPAADIYLIGTCGEEIGAGSAAFASGSIPGTITLAVDVGPVAAEYGTRLTVDPIIVHRDGRSAYTRSVCEQLDKIGRGLGMVPQHAYFESYGSDASISRTTGHAAKTGLLCVPTENTHGFEILPKAALESCARLLAGYLEAPV